MTMVVSQDRQRRREAAFKAFERLQAAGIIRRDKASEAVLILEDYVKPIEVSQPLRSGERDDA